MKKKSRLIFNAISIIFLLTLVVFYGYRLIHYYTLEHKTYENKEVHLYEKLIDSKGIEGTDKGLLTKDNGYIYASKSDDNYLYYVGRLWRIISIDDKNNIKLITDDIQTLLTYENDTEFSNSNINTWLNKTETDNSGIFESSLKEETTKLMKQNNLISTLLTQDEYELLNKNNYLVIDNPFWIITKDNELAYIDAKGEIKDDSEISQFYGVRPVIVLSSETLYLSGNGSKQNPYIILNNMPERISGAFAGEYVNFSGLTWKVISSNETGVTIVLDSALDEKMSFSTKNNIFNTKEGIGKYLNNDFYEELENKDYINLSTFYIGNYTLNNEYNYLNTYSKSIEAYVGLYKLGDLCVNNYPNIFTLTPYVNSSKTIYAINDKNKVYADLIDSEYEARPVINLAPDLFVIDGKGTKESPYEIGR